jgi:RimJ/RimL family protein N-acetyltransferase
METTTTITTERLSLRCYRQQDAEAVYQLIDENRERLIQSFPTTVAAVAKPDDAVKFVAAKIAQWQNKEHFYWGGWAAETLVAYVCIKNIDWEKRDGELAYFISKSAEGKGYVTEAVKAVTRYGFQQLNMSRLYLRVIPGNEKSVGVAARCGFSFEKTEEKGFKLANGEMTDVIYYSQLK